MQDSSKYQVTQIAGRGVGVLATKDIVKGETLWEDKVILNARVTSNTDNFHNISLLNRQVEQLSPSERQHFLSLHDPDPGGPDQLKNARIYANNTYFDGCYLLSSRINHSCKPNVMLSSDDTIHTEVVALRNILAGEEILVSYLRTSELETKKERTEKIKNWEFHCDCELCNLKGEESLKNDRNRLEVRNNLKIIDSFFDDLWKNPSTLPDVVKPKLKQLYELAETTLSTLQLDLAGQSDAAVVATYLKMAELVAFSQTSQFVTTLPGKHSARELVNLAREQAALMGRMFLSNCDTMERELRELEEEFC